MSELIIVGFNDREGADRVLLRLSKLRKEYLIDIEDAVVVVRDEDGKVHLKQGINLVTAGAATGFVSGSLWGTLVGFLFLNPLAGFVLGSAIGVGAGALSGSLSDYGINDDFIKSLAETIPPNSSSLFILVRKVQPEKVLAELSGVKGKVLGTSLLPSRRKSFNKLLKTPHPPQVDEPLPKNRHPERCDSGPYPP